MNIEEYLKILVSGKRVAFVGLAPNIKGKGLGVEIDSFDVVIRTNIYPIPEEQRGDYGQRCDILVLHIRYTNYKYAVKNIMHYRKVADKSPNINYCLITKNDRRKVSKAVMAFTGKDPKWGTQGTNLMHFCIEAGCKEFKFFGITGYQNLKGELTDKGNYTAIAKPRKSQSIKRSAGVTKSPSHNHKVLNDYTRHMLKIKAIDMDEYSKEYFN